MLVVVNTKSLSLIIRCFCIPCIMGLSREILLCESTNRSYVCYCCLSYNAPFQWFHAVDNNNKRGYYDMHGYTTERVMPWHLCTSNAEKQMQANKIVNATAPLVIRNPFLYNLVRQSRLILLVILQSLPSLPLLLLMMIMLFACGVIHFYIFFSIIVITKWQCHYVISKILTNFKRTLCLIVFIRRFFILFASYNVTFPYCGAYRE